MPLSPVEQRFVLHWGEMGTRWGINRTVAQVHALLFLSPKPLHAEEIATTLAVARSNVSTSLRELQGWGIVRVAHVLGDRRDHFESVKDVWEIFRIVAEERVTQKDRPVSFDHFVSTQPWTGQLSSEQTARAFLKLVRNVKPFFRRLRRRLLPD